jgi:lipopolysaccharide export system permease protein
MKFFTILDRYIIKKFLSTFFVAIMLMIAIILIFDLSDKLGKFMDNQIPAKKVIFDYYLSFIPYYANLFMSLFVFISIIFFTSKMAGKSEFIAILSSGTSFLRILVPYFIAALFLASFSFALGSFIIPPANKTRIEFENQYIYYRPNLDTRDVHKQVSQGIFVYVKFYDVVNDIGHIFTIEQFEGSELVSKMYADNIFWDEEKELWRANNYWIRDYRAKSDIMTKGSSIDTNIYITPEDIKETAVDISTLNLIELNDYIKSQKLHGNDSLNEFLLEKHKRIALPFSMFILSFIGVTMSSKKVRGGTGLNMGIGIGLSFAYILFTKVSDQWAISGNMTPFFAVWTPNFIFSFISVFLYRFAPK